MNKFSFLLSLLLLPLGMVNASDVPAKVRFADLDLNIETETREKIEKKVKSLTLSQKHFEDYVNRCKLYFPLIEKVFEEENLPKDFRFLALQESAMVADAVSSSGAVGYWQFKDFTAIEMQMRVDDQIDQRKHIIEASRGAARYLKKNNLYMRNWVFSLLSYNLGLTGARNYLKKELKDVEEVDLDAFTHLYIVHFLAHKLAFEDQANSAPAADITLLEYPNANGQSLAQIASLTGINILELQRFNRWLNVAVIPNDRPYSVILPVPTQQVMGIAAAFQLEIPGKGTMLKPPVINLPKEEKPQPQMIEVVVQDNDNPYPIISKSETKTLKGIEVTLVTANGTEAIIANANQSVKDIASALEINDKKFRKMNDMGIGDELKEGQVYYLKNKKSKGPVPFHTVVEESNLWQVAQRYGIKVKNLAKNNRMEVNAPLEQGRVLWLQKKRPSKVGVEIKELPKKQIMINTGGTTTDTTTDPLDMPPAESVIELDKTNKTEAADISSLKANEGYHVVKNGETLFVVSRKYNVTILDLKEWNDLPANLSLTDGQILRVRRPDDNGSETTTAGNGNQYDPENPIILDQILKDEIGTPADPLAQPAGTKDVPEQVIHTVKSGETMAIIAQQYGVSQGDIMTWNNLPSYLLNVNQQLVIRLAGAGTGTTKTGTGNTGTVKLPAGNPSANTTGGNTGGNSMGLPSEAKYHVFVAKETLYSVSRKYNVSVNNLKLWNPALDPSSIPVGQKIYVENPLGTATANSQPITTNPGNMQSDPLNQPAGTSDPLNQPAGTVDPYSQPAGGLPATTTPANQGTAKVNIPADGYHTVQQGETLFDIALIYSLPVMDLRKWNGLSETANVSPGQKLALIAALAPVGGQTTTTTTTTLGNQGNEGASAGQPIYHRVAKGETLYAISRKYNQKVGDLQKWNNIVGGNINFDQKLIVGYGGGSSPANTTTNVTSNNGAAVYHTVAKGETLYGISVKYKVKVDQIKQLNNMSDNTVKVDQKLRIK